MPRLPVAASGLLRELHDLGPGWRVPRDGRPSCPGRRRGFVPGYAATAALLSSRCALSQAIHHSHLFCLTLTSRAAGMARSAVREAEEAGPACPTLRLPRSCQAAALSGNPRVCTALVSPKAVWPRGGRGRACPQKCGQLYCSRLKPSRELRHLGCAPRAQDRPHAHPAFLCMRGLLPERWGAVQQMPSPRRGVRSLQAGANSTAPGLTQYRIGSYALLLRLLLPWGKEGRVSHGAELQLFHRPLQHGAPSCRLLRWSVSPADTSHRCAEAPHCHTRAVCAAPLGWNSASLLSEGEACGCGAAGRARGRPLL
jgi:hypothetical protein